MILEGQLLQKLKQLRSNNNDLIKELNKLNQETISTSEKLTALEKESESLSVFYSEISTVLLEISSELNYLKECSKKKKQTTSKNSNTKNQNKKKSKIKSLKKIEDLSLDEQSKKYKQIIIFLFNEFMKNKDPDDIVDDNIDDEDNTDDQISQEE